MLRLVYRWHSNFQPACERGAYLSFLLVSSIVSSADTPRFVQHCEPATITAGKVEWNTVQLTLDPSLGDWNDVVLFVRLYSYNSISPGVFAASATSVRTRTWAAQRTAYVMIPTESSQAQRTYRMRSMLPLDQPPKGWIEIDWRACEGMRPSHSPLLMPQPRMFDALDVAQGEDLKEGPNADATKSPGSETNGTSPLAVLMQEQQKPGALTGVALTRRRQETLQRVCTPWTHAEQRHMDVNAPFICRGLRDKYAPDVYLPIGPVPCMVYLMSLGRGAFAEKLPVEYVGYLARAVRGLWPLTLPAESARGQRSLTAVDRLELLHSVCTLHAQLRPYKLDAIDVCPEGVKPASSVAAVSPDWFDLMEENDPQPIWSPHDKQQALHNSLVAAETGGFFSFASASTSTSSSSVASSSKPTIKEHICAASDQIDHDFQGAHMADQSNDCDSRVSSVAIMFDRIQHCSIADSATYHHATSLFRGGGDEDDDDSETVCLADAGRAREGGALSDGLMLSSIAKQYVFVYTIVAALPEYNSLDSVEQVHKAAYALRTNHPEILTTPASQTQLSDADHNKYWVDPFGFACHVVGLWFPRTQWRLLCDRGMRFKQGGFASLGQHEPIPPPCDLPSGVCDPSDNTHAMQFVERGLSPSPTLPTQAGECERGASPSHPYDLLHDEHTGFAHARLVFMRKPRSYTKDYMQYAMAVTACEYTNMRRDPAVGDVIFVNTETRTYGVPLAQLMRPDALVPRLDMRFRGMGPTPPSDLATFAAEPMTEPLSLQQRHDIQECLNLIPRPGALSVSEFPSHAASTETAPSMSASSATTSTTTSASQTTTTIAWMTRTNWLQVDPATSRSYGDLFLDWCRQPPQSQRNITVSHEFIWLADDCYAKRITFEP